MLALVLVPVCINVAAESWHWGTLVPAVAVWTVGLSAILAAVTYGLRAATLGAALTGAAINASLMYATSTYRDEPWRTAVVPVLAVFLLAFAATRAGRLKKERLGIAEQRMGRSAAQVAANLGAAALVTNRLVEARAAGHGWMVFAHGGGRMALFALALAALAEAAADTVSSELGQVIGGRPRMITTLRAVEPGRDGAISLAGTMAGILAAIIVSATGALAVGGGIRMFWIASVGGVFGLFFDSLLGATLEQRGLLNNDAVNFLSTVSAAAFAWALMR